RLEAEFPRGVVGDDGHARSRIEHKTQRLFLTVDADLQHGSIVCRFESDRSATLATGDVERTLPSEVTEKIDQADDAGAPIDVRLGGDQKKPFIRVSRFFVFLTSRGGLAQVEKKVRLIRIQTHGAAQAGHRGEQT